MAADVSHTPAVDWDARAASEPDAVEVVVETRRRESEGLDWDSARVGDLEKRPKSSKDGRCREALLRERKRETGEGFVRRDP